MNFVIALVKQLSFPLLFKTDFRSPLWKVSERKAKVGLIASSVVNLLVLFLLGQMDTFNVLLAVLFPVGFWMMPPRLAFAASALNASLALTSLLVIFSLLVLQVHPSIVQASAYLWQLWGMLALIHMALKYLRTPKREMP